MRTIQLIIAIIATVTFSLSNLNAQSEKTLVKTINAYDATSILVSFEAKTDSVEVEEWDESTVRVSVTINASTSKVLLDYLSNVGRYSINTKIINNVLVLDMEKLSKTVIIKGADLEESLKVKIQVPRGLTQVACQKELLIDRDQSLNGDVRKLYSIIAADDALNAFVGIK